MADADRRPQWIAWVAPLVILAFLIPSAIRLLTPDEDNEPTPASDAAAVSEQIADPPTTSEEPDGPSATAVAGAPSPIVVAADGGPAGDGTAEDPYGSIQHALERAEPGDTVQVGPGTYDETIRSVQSGSPGQPITVIGDNAAIVGNDDVNHLVTITHDHIVLRDLELRDASTLVYVSGASNVRILDNDILDAQGECVRIKYKSVDNEVAGNDITDCGTEDFDLDDDEKNGEGVYIGTAPEQLDDNPTDEPDESNANHVHGNRIEVPAECVDVKEYARANLIENNECSGSQDPDGGGFSSRGVGTVLRGNRSTGNAGAGIRLGGDTDRDGTDSVVRDNVLTDNGGYGLRVAAEPQRLLCGNEISGNDEGTDDLDDVDPTDDC